MFTLEKADGTSLRSAEDDLLRTQLPVHGLMCVSDAVRLEHYLGHVQGVHDATVNPVTDVAYITYDPQQIGRGELMEAITRAGFRTGYWVPAPLVSPRRRSTGRVYVPRSAHPDP